jgi:hypothetical protein
MFEFSFGANGEWQRWLCLCQLQGPKFDPRQSWTSGNSDSLRQCKFHLFLLSSAYKNHPIVSAELNTSRVVVYGSQFKMVGQRFILLAELAVKISEYLVWHNNVILAPKD